ncbi:MAG TPA: STT3 domain-containing protein [Thermoanaerobaculia bacterium]
MASRRALLLFGLAGALIVGIALRLTTRTQLTWGGRVHALTSDDNYHLRRARFALSHYPRTILFDPLMNFPDGGVPIWPPLFDVALATPTRVLHGADAPPGELEREAASVPLFFAAGAILFAGLLGRQIFGDAGGVAVALFVAVCPGHILWTQYGHADQHVAESFFGLLVLWLFVRSRDETRPEAKALSEIAAGTALALSVLAWQGAIYWGAIIALCLFLEALRTRESQLGASIRLLALAAAVSGLATLAWLGGFRPPLTYISFGLFQPLFLAGLAGGTILLETGLRAMRKQLSARDLAWRAAVLAAAAVAVLPFARGLGLGLARGVGYVLGVSSGELAASSGYVSYPAGWLKGIFEARPLLADGPALASRQLSLAFFLTPLAAILWTIRAFRNDRAPRHIALAVWGLVTLVLALSQRLNVYYAAPLVAVTLVEVVRLVFRSVGTRSPAVRVAAAAGTGLLVLAPMAAGLRSQVRETYVPGRDLFTTLDWMRSDLPHSIDPYDRRFVASPGPPEAGKAAAVLAPWSLGHLILYESGLPVVANNFGYGFTDSILFFLAESEEEALAIARRRGVRWVLATDLVPRLNDYAGYVGRTPPLAVTAQGLRWTPRYLATLQSRLYDFDGSGVTAEGVTIPPLAHFQLRFRSRTAIERGGRRLARWKVFEVLEN